ncbi:unnamed protein product [Dibothriocephalus latus]|uniref:Uncharacterized protein n=1 Tax=Dibothriocephalus latus TaxID=60516 RepID=A0A3P7M5T0_DIBLA|nr:unnamed protein product [Dibothriocephalus latus]
MEYLRQYLRVAPRWARTCGKVFQKFADEGIMPKEKLSEALAELTFHPLAESSLDFILKLIGLKFSRLPPIDSEYWKGISAVTDRLLFSRLLQRDGKTLTEKGTLEMADFSTAYRQLEHLRLNSKLTAMLRIL